MNERTAVAIIGAGITGLTLAHYLRSADVPHVVFEASERVGGVIRSARVDGHLLEWGPQRTRLTQGIRELLEDLSIIDATITASPDLPLLVYRAGKLRQVPFSAGAFLTSDIIPHRAKLRLLLEPFTLGADPQESVASYFTRKLGRELYENMAGPLYGGLYASDPADMIVGLSLGNALREFNVKRSLVWPLIRRGGSVSPPTALSFAEGMETLPRALFARNAENIRLSTPVSQLSRNALGNDWLLEFDGGSIRAERVVLTAPAGMAARLLLGEAPEAAAALSGLHYNPLAIVHLNADTTLRGLGYQISFAEKFTTRGVTFNDSIFGRKGVYTSYLGGSKAPGAVKWSDEKLGELAVREFRTVTGFESDVISVEREVMPAWDRSWAQLSGMRLPAGLTVAANWESRPGLPGRLAQAKRLAGMLAKELGGNVPDKPSQK